MPTVDFRKLIWQDYPSRETPINAENLNRIEEGLAGLYHDLDAVDFDNIAQRLAAIDLILGNFGTLQLNNIASKDYETGEYIIYNFLLYRTTDHVTSGNLLTPGTNMRQTTISAEMANKILDYEDVPISSGTGDIGSINDPRITAAHKVQGRNIVWGNPSAITSGIDVKTYEGYAVITGTSTAATTATFTLFKPDN